METVRSQNLSFSYVGPKIGQEAKTVLYFSLSAKDSLITPPYCNPVKMLEREGFRILSTTLPGHENDDKPMNIKELWGSSLSMLEQFIETLTKAIEELPFSQIAVMGLSRGAFIAAHLAARSPKVSHILGFAPLTFLEGGESLNLETLADKLFAKTLRFYIGHKDTLVHTERVLSFIQSCIDAGVKHKLNSPNIDLVIKPSVGSKGHGTLDQTFKEGCQWLTHCLE